MERRDLDAWREQEPDDDFAGRVVAQTLLEQPRKKDQRPPKRRRLFAWGSAATLAAAAAALWLVTHPAVGSGDIVAEQRIEARLDDGVAVLEAGAAIAWRGREVSQKDGDVFYRVEPGEVFLVHTPAGSVTVKGTCFRVRVRPARDGSVTTEQHMNKRDAGAAAVGASLAALTVVTVYEGSVQLSHAGEQVDLAAGESGQSDGDGVQKLDGGGLAQAERALQKRAEQAETRGDELAQGVADLRRKVGKLEKQKTELEQQLDDAKARLSKASAGDADSLKHDFDLDAEDWKALAETGTIKFRSPCIQPNGWEPSAETADTLGLAPDDIPVLHDAYKRSNERVWSSLRTLCIDAIGNESVVDILGPGTCVHVITDVARKNDPDAASAAQKMVAEMRAGTRPLPGPDDEVHPTVAVFLTMTGELSQFETDLAEAFGPEEAHRLAYADEMCMHHSTFGGGKSGPPKK